MLIQRVKIRKMRDAWLILTACLILVVLGLVLGEMLPEEEHSLQTFAGMLTGFGIGVAAVAIISVIRVRRKTPEQLKQMEIEEKDERNIRIAQMSYSVMAVASYIILAILSFVFTLMGEFLVTCIMIAAMYAQIVVGVIARRIISKKI